MLSDSHPLFQFPILSIVLISYSRHFRKKTEDLQFFFRTTATPSRSSFTASRRSEEVRIQFPDAPSQLNLRGIPFLNVIVVLSKTFLDIVFGLSKPSLTLSSAFPNPFLRCEGWRLRTYIQTAATYCMGENIGRKSILLLELLIVEKQ